ncbi:ABC transporter substrate-binding protein [Actinomadura viridis]|uniref:ABC transporter substrate-binding protein n=1 Tax=Actinomadura viridis TaxID=58110 RepID=UPI0036AD717D
MTRFSFSGDPDRGFRPGVLPSTSAGTMAAARSVVATPTSAPSARPRPRPGHRYGGGRPEGARCGVGHVRIGPPECVGRSHGRVTGRDLAFTVTASRMWSGSRHETARRAHDGRAQCRPAAGRPMLAHGTGTAVTRDGAKNWYIVYPDYAFGQDMQKTFTAAVQKAGGTVVKADPAPFPNDNFSTFLLKAPGMNPKPQVLGTMQAGGDLVNLVKQYNEYKLRDKGVGLAAGLMFLTDIHSLGPDAMAGTRFTDAWYWNADQKNRAWADRFQAKTGKRPTSVHAANYSAALQYLEAVQRGGTDKADDVVGQLEGRKVEDVFARNGTIRAEDHLLLHDAYLAQVKPSAEVKEPWDYQRILKTIPASEAFQPQPDPACKL